MTSGGVSAAAVAIVHDASCISRQLTLLCREQVMDDIVQWIEARLLQPVKAEMPLAT
jgi:hypothetical protein